MQNVAWPMMIVISEKVSPRLLKNEFSAMPVMIPGRAIGSTMMNDTASRPKKRKRCTANAAIDPSRSEMAVEISAARTDSQNASRASWLWNVDENHFVDSPGGGQLWTFDLLNA